MGATTLGMKEDGIVPIVRDLEAGWRAAPEAGGPAWPVEPLVVGVLCEAVAMGSAPFAAAEAVSWAWRLLRDKPAALREALGRLERRAAPADRVQAVRRALAEFAAAENATSLLGDTLARARESEGLGAILRRALDNGATGIATRVHAVLGRLERLEGGLTEDVEAALIAEIPTARAVQALDALALGRRPTPRSPLSNALVAALGRPEPTVVQAALRATASLHVREAQDGIARLLAEGAPDPEETAPLCFDALEVIGDGRVVRALEAWIYAHRDTAKPATLQRARKVTVAIRKQGLGA